MQQSTVCLQHGFHMGGNLWKLFKSDDTEQFGRMCERSAVQIINAEHAPGKFWRSQHPTATQAAEPIGFGETVGHDEALRIDMERTGGRRFKKHLAVDFVDQN